MGIPLELPPDVEAALQADAKAQGRRVEEVAAERLAALTVPARNPADPVPPALG